MHDLSTLPVLKLLNLKLSENIKWFDQMLNVKWIDQILNVIWINQMLNDKLFD